MASRHRFEWLITLQEGDKVLCYIVVQSGHAHQALGDAAVVYKETGSQVPSPHHIDRVHIDLIKPEALPAVYKRELLEGFRLREPEGGVVLGYLMLPEGGDIEADAEMDLLEGLSHDIE